MKTTSTPTPTPPSPTPLKMSKANFPWSSSRKVQNDDTLDNNQTTLKTEENRGKQDTINNHPLNDIISDDNHKSLASSTARRRRKLQAIAVSRIRSVLTALNINKSSPSTFPNLGSCPKVIGTLFGYRKGHVHFVFQREHNSAPVFFIELATQITHLVKEMASGLVRIALECDKDDQQEQEKSQKLSQEHEKRKKVRRKRLLEEQVWRTYCNGKKCGFANKREIGPNEAKILKAVEPISMGAGVLPGFNGSGSGSEGELMYMRAQFERVVGSRDSEAFYMMNPDCHGAPELSIYLLRV